MEFNVLKISNERIKLLNGIRVYKDGTDLYITPCNKRRFQGTKIKTSFYYSQHRRVCNTCVNIKEIETLVINKKL